MNTTDKEIKELLTSLNKSKFRGSFHLNDKMKKYVQDKGYKPLVDFWEDWNVEIITDLSKFCKKTKSTATKKKVDSNNEQTLRCNLGKALLEYNKKDRKLIIDTVLLGKTKTDVNNKLVKLTGNTKTAGEIYKKIKDLI